MYVKITNSLIKTKMKSVKNIASPKIKLGYLTLAVALFGFVGTAVYVHADQFDAQINALQQQNSGAQSNINNLASQAGSYQAAINVLQSQINGIQAALTVNLNKQTALQQQIDADKQNIITQKLYLGEDIKTMYIDGQLSTIEQLATSRNLSDFVDKQEYRSIVQDKVDALIKQIAKLQSQLQQQKGLLDILITTENEQNAQLGSAEAQQQQLLSYNQSQQNTFNQQIQANQSQISSLRQQQAIANHRLGGNDVAGDPNHGGYPAKWDYPVPQDSELDSWGMLNRECVSYTAWKVYQTFGYMPYWGGVGNAKQWPGDAQSAGIPTGSTPKVHSVAISTGGAFGHAMWVESINGNGTINVSQYNKSLTGMYSETYGINPSGLIFIYFGG